MTNDCKTCPVSTGTHKPAEAVHQIAEPAASVEKQIKDAIDALVMAAFTEGGCSEHRMSEARIQTELRKKELRTLLSTPQPCSRSHPHEEMTPMCELRTEIARLTNALARTEAAAPQAVQAAVPLPLLLRDIARDLGITVPQACIALKPLGNYSTNSAVTSEMAKKLREAFPVPAQTNREAVIQHLTKAGVLEHDGCGVFIASGVASELIDACMTPPLSTHPTQQGLDAQALKQSFREYLSVSEHIDAGGHAMDSIATDLTRIVLAEEEVSAVIARRVHCNTSGQSGEDAENIRAAAQAKQGGAA